MIEPEILIAYGGISKKYNKGEFIFHEGTHCYFYYQIIEGTIKMFNTNSEGKEFTQAEFKSGSSFGEPPLFLNELYPASAISCDNSVIMKISKDKFFEVLEAYPNIQMKLLTVLSRRLYNKSTTAAHIINHAPESKILAFLDAYKKKTGNENKKIEIPYTRQEIANYTGLRVETVIRTLTKMSAAKTVTIEKRKLIY